MWEKTRTNNKMVGLNANRSILSDKPLLIEEYDLDLSLASTASWFCALGKVTYP